MVGWGLGVVVNWRLVVSLMFVRAFGLPRMLGASLRVPLSWSHGTRSRCSSPRNIAVSSAKVMKAWTYDGLRLSSSLSILYMHSCDIMYLMVLFSSLLTESVSSAADCFPPYRLAFFALSFTFASADDTAFCRCRFNEPARR